MLDDVALAQASLKAGLLASTLVTSAPCTSAECWSSRRSLDQVADADAAERAGVVGFAVARRRRLRGFHPAARRA